MGFPTGLFPLSHLGGNPEVNTMPEILEVDEVQ